MTHIRHTGAYDFPAWSGHRIRRESGWSVWSDRLPGHESFSRWLVLALIKWPWVRLRGRWDNFKRDLLNL